MIDLSNMQFSRRQDWNTDDLVITGTVDVSANVMIPIGVEQTAVSSKKILKSRIWNAVYGDVEKVVDEMAKVMIHSTDGPSKTAFLELYEKLHCMLSCEEHLSGG